VYTDGVFPVLRMFNLTLQKGFITHILFLQSEWYFVVFEATI